MANWRGMFLVGGITLVVMLANLGGSRLWDRDEPRNAGCAAEMLQADDWIVPRFNGELRTHKPVLLYWLIMASYQALGVDEFSARLPSALLALGTVLCSIALGRHFWGTRAGNWAGLAVGTSVLMVLAGRAATPDSTLIFCTTLSLTFFALGIPQANHSRALAPSPLAASEISGWRAVGVYGAMGAAALAKGPVGIVLPAAIMGLYQWLAALPLPDAPLANEPLGTWRSGWALCRRWSRGLHPRAIGRTIWQLRPLTGALVLLVVVVPWYALVGWRTDGEFLRGFFGEHNLGRALNTMEGHRGNLLFYPATLLVGTFPWSILAVPLILDLTRSRRDPEPGRAGVVLATCWILVYVAVFSAAKTKLPSYVTPTYPAMGMLIGRFLERWLAGGLLADRRWLMAAGGVLTTVGSVLAFAVAWAANDKLPGEAWLGIVGLLPFTCGLALAWSAWRRQDELATRWLAVMGTGFSLLLFALGAARADRHQRSDLILAAIERHSDHPRIGAYACLEPSWVFYGGHAIDELTEGTVAPTHRPKIQVDGRWIAKPPISLADIAAAGPDALIITTAEQLPTVQSRLPPDFAVLERAPLFLKELELVLLGRVPITAPTRQADSAPRAAARPR